MTGSPHGSSSSRGMWISVTIAAIDRLADPARLGQLDLTILDDAGTAGTNRDPH